MILKNKNSAVRINGDRSLLLSDNLICRYNGRTFDPIIELVSPEIARMAFRRMLSKMLSDDILYVDDEDCWGKPFCSERKYAYSYVCFEDMLVRLDDVASVRRDEQCATVVEFVFTEGRSLCYDFASEKDAVFAFDAIVEQVNTPGVLLLECRGDAELMAYLIH